LKHVTGIRLDEEMVKKWYHRVRLPGTSIPGVITAGTFYQEGKGVFWDVHHPAQAVLSC
jgi:hypothetical protein